MHEAVGEPIEIEILRAQPWSGHRVVADRYRDGRVFLAGDAAHLLWPRAASAPTPGSVTPWTSAGTRGRPARLGRLRPAGRLRDRATPGGGAQRLRGVEQLDLGRWLPDGSSILDHFGYGFVLVATATADPAPMVRAASTLGVPLRVLRIDRPAVVRLYAAPMVLVRPHGHVAWRGASAPDDPIALLDRVRGAGPLDDRGVRGVRAAAKGER
ncbi:FAD-dependent monooxygenase [Pseudonocardia sp. HH130629-09]|uniref:FAD-dependent monooxygenase n=1 Tax=Pseudonocardia sp. HH130629-09 TaxID=1641402 RepID=UPI001875E234